MPLTLYDINGIPIWDTDTTPGGVIADVLQYASSATGSKSYPSFQGRTAFIFPLNRWIWPTPINVALDYDQGYPRVTVGTAIGDRRFAVLVL